MLDKDHDVVVLFQDAATPLSDDDGEAILCYRGTVATLDHADRPSLRP